MPLPIDIDQERDSRNRRELEEAGHVYNDSVNATTSAFDEDIDFDDDFYSSINTRIPLITATASGRSRLDVGRQYNRYIRRSNVRRFYTNSNSSSQHFGQDSANDDNTNLDNTSELQDEDHYTGLIVPDAESRPETGFNLPSSYLRRYALSQRSATNAALSSSSTAASLTSNPTSNRSNDVYQVSPGRTSLLSALNAASSEAVSMDLLTSSESSIFNHSETGCGTSKNRSYLQSIPLCKTLDTFLYRRRAAAVKYDKQRVWRSSNTKKRSFRAVIGEKEHDPYEEFMFDEIRMSPNSFLKAGICFTCVNEDISVGIIHVDLVKCQVSGFLEFKETQSLKKWIKYYGSSAMRSKRLDSSTTVLAFTANVVDFERFDLRFKSCSFDALMGTYTQESSGNYYIPRKDDYSVMYSNFINRQLYKWRMLKPFKGLSVEQHKGIMTCTKCIAKLQSRYQLMHVFLEGGDHTELLMSLDKRCGTLEAVSAGDSDAMSMRRSAMGIVPTLDRVMRFIPNTARYVSPSISMK